MCSIGGFVSREPLPGWLSFRLLRALLFYGAPRGKQSSGIWINGQLLKKAQAPEQFIERDDFAALFKKPATLALVHTRQPTCGGTGDEQAHPFQVGRVISVHNGMFSNVEQLKKKFDLDKPSGVDSELVPSFIEQHGIEALPEFLSKTVGSSSIAVHILNDGLYLARDNGSLEYYLMKDGKNELLVFGSTQTILTSALRHVWLLPEYTHTITIKNGTLFKASPTGVEQISEPIRYSSTSSYHGHSHHGYSGYGYAGGRGYGDAENWRAAYPNAHRGAGESRWPHRPGEQPKALPPASKPAELPLHNNPRDTELQRQLGPLFELKLENGKRLWIYNPEGKKANEAKGGSDKKPLNRRARRKQERERRAAQKAAAAAERAGAGSGTESANGGAAQSEGVVVD